jgi:hypothetical protein
MLLFSLHFQLTVNAWKISEIEASSYRTHLDKSLNDLTAAEFKIKQLESQLKNVKIICIYSLLLQY